MTDPRPRPQYGEYATPEEQAKAMGVPAPIAPSEADVAAAAAVRPATSPSANPASAAATPPARRDEPALESRGAATSAPGAARPKRLWDQILTALLLGIGIVSVTSSIPQYADFPATLDVVLAQFGYTGYSEPELATSIGIALNVTQIVLYIVGAVLAFVMIRRRRLAFIYPLIAGFLFVVVSIVLLSVAFAADPTLIENLTL